MGLCLGHLGDPRVVSPYPRHGSRHPHASHPSPRGRCLGRPSPRGPVSAASPLGAPTRPPLPSPLGAPSQPPLPSGPLLSQLCSHLVLAILTIGCFCLFCLTSSGLCQPPPNRLVFIQGQFCPTRNVRQCLDRCLVFTCGEGSLLLASSASGPPVIRPSGALERTCSVASNPWSLAAASVRGILQTRRLEWVGHFLLQGIFPTQGLNAGLLQLAGGFFTTEPHGKPQSRTIWPKGQQD